MLLAAPLLAAWVIMLWVSRHAIAAMGTSAAGAVFFGDMAHPWRAQFNVDFGLHLLLIAAWMLYRARNVATGLITALLAIMCGGAFTFAYLAWLVWTTRGDPRAILLGQHHPATGVRP
ncbi:hypothetical protein F9288_12135 [Sphingomonas sp. CL5.1]|uniref:hypothetical protein n=1 Tax=Sphingomonas sp. CL5.1 TaxID=2653203 RepID=UPI0015831C07|nr:hypothetical protein [Sphingomonas sp. CL5.1]QKS00289.1 hypothetical protein F9288_12135 [Sphingomonas sp. CL5.1]